jgi:FkbM family methyltransferase
MIIGLDEYRTKYDFSDVRGIIHVGAHIGQEYRDYNSFFHKDIPIHWFEPQRDVFEDLVRNLSGARNNYFYNFGLGSFSGNLQFWRDSGNSGQSSSFSCPDKHKEIFPHITFDNSEHLDIRTLDHFNIREANLLVLDVQGFELEVLKGATSTLEFIDHIFCEINTDKIYEDSPTLDELNSFLDQRGFNIKETWWTDGEWGDGYWNKK